MVTTKCLKIEIIIMCRKNDLQSSHYSRINFRDYGILSCHSTSEYKHTCGKRTEYVQVDLVA